MRISLRALIAAAAVATASQAAADVASLAAGTCAACHGAAGVSANAQYPDLAGQEPGYLRAALQDFRSGARPSTIMQPFAASLSDAEIAGLAAFYARQPRATAEADETGLSAEGRRIYLRRVRGIRGPACAACHGGGQGSGFGHGMMGGGMMGGMSTDPAVTPRLAGQHGAYLAAQLDAFASGTRPDTIMGPIAAALTETQRKAVAAYLAGLH
jgi:cytochrome c553